MNTQGVDPKKRSVALIGLRGCGKSTVGRELARLLGCVCIDTDAMIEEEAGYTIADIFAKGGEAGFRKRERDAVARAVRTPAAVISVGGGAVLDLDNVRMLRSVANVVWLTASAEVLWDRVQADPKTSDSRPALTEKTGVDELRQLLADRKQYYEDAADVTIDTEGKTPGEVAEAIEQILRSLP